MVARLEMIESKCFFAMRSAGRLRRYVEMTGVPPEIVDHERRLLERLLTEVNLIRSLDDDDVLFDPSEWRIEEADQPGGAPQTHDTEASHASVDSRHSIRSRRLH